MGEQSATIATKPEASSHVSPSVSPEPSSPPSQDFNRTAGELEPPNHEDIEVRAPSTQKVFHPFINGT